MTGQPTIAEMKYAVIDPAAAKTADNLAAVMNGLAEDDWQYLTELRSGLIIFQKLVRVKPMELPGMNVIPAHLRPIPDGRGPV